MARSRFGFFALIALTLMMLACTASIGFITAEIPSQRRAPHLLESTHTVPERIMEPADTTQSLSFTLDSWDYKIVRCDYSSSHLDTRFTYRLSFTVSGGSLEFFICLAPEANNWALGYPIYVSDSDHWGSTAGVTTERSFRSNVALAFVFNHEGSGSRTISGSVTVDTSGPSIATSLVNNDTYTGTIAITANATDTMTGVESMEILIDDDEKRSTTSGSLDYAWRTTSYSNGNHTIEIRAEDGAGHVSTVIYVVWVDNQWNIFGGSESLGMIVGLGVFAVCIYCGGKGNSWRKKRGGNSVGPPDTWG